MSAKQAAREAQIDAMLYGTGLVKITHDETGFHYERLDPELFQVCKKPERTETVVVGWDEKDNGPVYATKEIT
jgi:hypothetical protein